MDITPETHVGARGIRPASEAGPQVSDEFVGQRIADRYRVVEELGRGGMGVVLRATDERGGRDVALKLVHRNSPNRSPEADRRFLLEAQAGARLTHPNCVGVLDHGSTDTGALFLVMELVAGHSLADQIDDVGRFAWREALRIVGHVLRALTHVHAQGVLHRDIKPDNIMIDPRSDDPLFARLVDFGVAKLMAGDGADVRLTATGIVVGTPRYLSPEQAIGGELGPWTDLYCLSVVLYELLTGRPPFDGQELIQVVTAHAMVPPPDPRTVCPEADLPDGVVALVLQGLAKHAIDRPAGAAAYLAQVEALLNDGPGEAAPADSLLPGSASAARTSIDQPIGHATTLHMDQTPLPVRAAVDLGAPVQRRRRPRGLVVGLGVAGAIAALVVGFGVMGPSSTSRRNLASPVMSPEQREQQLQAALALLVGGKTCKERLRAVEDLRALADPRAATALKRARYRMRGGLLGVGDENTNGCLRKAAEAALAELPPTSK